MIKLIVIMFLVVFIFKIFPISNYDRCYAEREGEGYAIFGCCYGLTGGTRNTGYLQESCINCPYLVLADDEKEKTND